MAVRATVVSASTPLPSKVAMMLSQMKNPSHPTASASIASVVSIATSYSFEVGT
jgi:hypothetical protein